MINSIIFSDGENELTVSGQSVPRIGESVAIRKDDGSLRLSGTVEDVVWTYRNGATVVTVWVRATEQDEARHG